MPITVQLAPSAEQQPGVEQLCETFVQLLAEHLHQVKLDTCCNITLEVTECVHRASRLSSMTRVSMLLVVDTAQGQLKRTFSMDPAVLASEFGSLEELQEYRAGRKEGDFENRADQLPIEPIPHDAANPVALEMMEFLLANVENPSGPARMKWKRLAPMMWIEIALAVAVSFIVMGWLKRDWAVAGITAGVAAVPWFGIFFAFRAALMPAHFFELDAVGRRIRAKIAPSASGTAVRGICIGVMVGLLIVIGVFWVVCLNV